MRLVFYALLPVSFIENATEFFLLINIPSNVVGGWVKRQGLFYRKLWGPSPPPLSLISSLNYFKKIISS